MKKEYRKKECSENREIRNDQGLNEQFIVDVTITLIVIDNNVLSLFINICKFDTLDSKLCRILLSKINGVKR